MALRFTLLPPLAAASLSLWALAPAPARAQAFADQNISSPAEGVLCDSAGSICYDAQGPSIGHTQTSFGRTASERLTRQLSSGPPVQDFRLSNGSVCDTRARLCWSDGFSKNRVAPRLTQKLFGSTSGSNSNSSGNSSAGLNRPQPGVVCDPAGQVCYDRMGLSLGLTREYYGTYAEQRVLSNLRGQAPPRQFRLSTGAACDLDVRRCWSDGWQRRSVDASLTRQLFGAETSSTTRLANCRLTRLFKVQSSGGCQITEQRGGGARSLDVALQDGSTYSFSRWRGEGFQIIDSKGTNWPVRLSDQGSTISFSWSDRVLTVTPQRQSNPGGPSLGQLIDALLKN
ncbi:MAG: YcgJ family protein [Prochlorococcaceae cyanobacterium]